MDKLLREIKACQICSDSLAHEPRPVLNAHPNSRILVIGQAPGIRVHESGIPWDDASGRNLRKWLGVNDEQFYNPELFAVIPMGFCYPGKSKSGDLPPRPECAPFWHDKLIGKMKNIQLTLLIGAYAQIYYLTNPKATLTETVASFKDYLPDYFPLVHPSPRNGIWMRNNPWFEEKVIPKLRKKIASVLDNNEGTPSEYLHY